MPPPPFNLHETAHPLSQHYHPAGNAPDEGVSPPPDSQFALASTDSLSHLASSDSEDFKGRVQTSPGGLPSFYQSVPRNTADAESPPICPGQRGHRDWRRHLEGWKLVLLDSCELAVPIHQSSKLTCNPGLNVLLLMIPIAWTIRLMMEEAYALVFSCAFTVQLFCHSANWPSLQFVSWR